MPYRHPARPRSRSEALTISCDDCVSQGTAACADCVVSFICGLDGGPIVIDLEERRTLGLLHDAGLVPALRHRR